jgi:hypothetical protein
MLKQLRLPRPLPHLRQPQLQRLHPQKLPPQHLLQLPQKSLQLKNPRHRFATTNPALLTSKPQTSLRLKQWTNVLRVADVHPKAANNQ